MSLPPFHLAIPVSDLKRSKIFYVDILGCTTGRVDKKWIDLDFFNHQLVLHKTENRWRFISSNKK